MENMAEVVRAARDAYGRRDWPGARDLFRRAGERGELSADDLYALGDAAWWLGRVDESVRAGEQAYRRYLDAGQQRQAAMAAIGVAVNLFLRGDDVVGSGWMSRAQRLLQNEPESIVHGYARYLLEVEAALEGPDLDAVIASTRRVRDIGQRHADPNLVAAGILGEGRALVKQGRVPDGMALLDEAMLAVLSGELDPEWAGNVYCHLMAACHELADIRRAGQWTEATARWLENLPAAVLFTGICRVHRSQVLQTRGAREDAEREAARACEDLTDISVATAAEGHYQVGEIRRLRGDLPGPRSRTGTPIGLAVTRNQGWPCCVSPRAA
jgi:tetratricopeptide (TPR) repeat protein